MSSSPSLFSSDSESRDSSDPLGYISRVDNASGFLSGANLSSSLGSLDFGTRHQLSETGFGIRPQDTGAMFSSNSMVCLSVLYWYLSGSFEGVWPLAI